MQLIELYGQEDEREVEGGREENMVWSKGGRGGEGVYGVWVGVNFSRSVLTAS